MFVPLAVSEEEEVLSSLELDDPDGEVDVPVLWDVVDIVDVSEVVDVVLVVDELRSELAPLGVNVPESWLAAL